MYTDHPLDSFVSPYSSVMHAKNLLMNLQKNYNIKDSFLEYCRRAERDQFHDRQPEVFRFVVRCFFCWHMANVLKPFHNEILEQWNKDYLASQEAYKAFENLQYKNWYEKCYYIKCEEFARFISNSEKENQ